MDGKLVFEKTSLKEVAAELERYFDSHIILGDKELHERSLTATFEKLSLKDVVTAICLSLSIDYQYKNDKYILIKKNQAEN